jgi:uncharacterized integral membrane protein
MAEPMQNDSTSGVPQGKMQGQASKFGGGAIASVIGLVLLLVFVLQNSKHVAVDFLFWTFTWPLWFLIIVAALLGALVWFGAGVVRRHRRRAERRDDRHS